METVVDLAKIGKLVLVETYLPENVKAEEEFVEEEHPRDEDGKFVADDKSTPDVNEAYEEVRVKKENT